MLLSQVRTGHPPTSSHTSYYITKYRLSLYYHLTLLMHVRTCLTFSHHCTIYTITTDWRDGQAPSLRHGRGHLWVSRVIQRRARLGWRHSPARDKKGLPGHWLQEERSACCRNRDRSSDPREAVRVTAGDRRPTYTIRYLGILWQLLWGNHEPWTPHARLHRKHGINGVRGVR